MSVMFPPIGSPLTYLLRMIARGNLSRTMIRATRPGLQVNITVDELDPAQTSMAEYEAHVRLQIVAMRR